jgi:predicted dehydrogenase
MRIGVAVVGAGMAGQAHAYGYRNAPMHPDLAGVDVDLVAIVDPVEPLARSAADRFGFARTAATIDEILDDDGIHAVSVALPNDRYVEVIPRLLAAGKHVLAEKPLGRDAAEAFALATAAQAANRTAAVGFSWRRLPAVEGIARLVQGGAIGPVWYVSGWFVSDYAATPETPLSWRYDKAAAGGGALLDVGAHLVSMLDHMVGPISRVLAAESRIVIPTRPVPAGPVVGHRPAELTGEYGPVTNDDVTIMLIEFAGGAVGEATVSRVASGIPNSAGFRLTGAAGSVEWESTRPDEYLLYERAVAPPERNGPRIVTVGPEHPHVGTTVAMPARGVANGYGGVFVTQAQEFLLAVAGRGEVATDFWSGYRTMLVCDAAQRAAESHHPMEIAHVDAEVRAGSRVVP